MEIALSGIRPVYAVGLATLTGRKEKWDWKRQLINDMVRKLIIVAHKKNVPRLFRDQAMWYACQLRKIKGGSASNAFETSLLALIFNATAIADIAADDQSGPSTTVTLSLHTADPGEGGTMTTSESAYTNYARQTVARTSGGWTVSGPTATLTANVSFPSSGASGTTITHFGIGTGVSNNLNFSGTVTPNIAIGASGITPILTTATAVTFD